MIRVYKNTHRVPDYKKHKTGWILQDEKGRYLQMRTNTKGNLGYTELGKMQPMFSLRVEERYPVYKCELKRQEDKKRPTDLMDAFLPGVLVAAVIFLIMFFVFDHSAALGITIGVAVGVLLSVAIRLVYVLEYRRFYVLLDQYMMDAYGAELKRGRH